MNETPETILQPEELRTLPVDDDPMVLHAYSRMLERYCVTGDTASNSKKAVERASRGADST
jgi:CheY-like chemotaxis protein